MIRTIACLMLAALLLCAPVAMAEESVQEIFDSLYGADVKKVSATSDTKDDAALAAQLVKDIRNNNVKDELMELMCNKAYELGLRDLSGYDAAASAMQQLASRIPDRRPACTDKLAEIRLKIYLSAPGQTKPEAAELAIEAFVAAADLREKGAQYIEAVKLLERAVSVANTAGSSVLQQLREKQRALNSVDASIKQQAALAAKIKEFLADRPVRAELVRLTLVELDNPAEAAKYVNETSTESMRMYIPLAAGGVSSLAEAACLDLGEWYRSLADGTSTAAKIAMLKRAKMYFDAYLAKHTADDLARTKATLALKKTEDLISAEIAESSIPEWTDLLKICRQQIDPRDSSWEFVNGNLLAKSGHFGRTDVPVSPDGSYEVMMRFRRNDSDEGVGLTLPVGTGEISVLLSEYNSRFHGMGMINGKSAYSNSTTIKPGKLANDEPYLLHVLITVKGKDADVAVKVNGRLAMHYAGPQDSMTAEHFWAGSNPRYLSLATQHSGFTFESFRLRVLSGKLNIPTSRPAAPSTQPTIRKPSGFSSTSMPKPAGG